MAIVGDDEAENVEFETVLDRGVVDFGDDFARPLRQTHRSPLWRFIRESQARPRVARARAQRADHARRDAEECHSIPITAPNTGTRTGARGGARTRHNRDDGWSTDRIRPPTLGYHCTAEHVA